ncbi:MAG: hypothetical protein PUC46_04115, partial [Lachnospiraceae bacterium]|nr:hypothetical protein [Lachnospiraceae bacterium]
MDYVNCLFLAEAKSAQAVSPNAAAGASAPMLLFENDASASFSNLAPLEKVKIRMGSLLTRRIF